MNEWGCLEELKNITTTFEQKVGEERRANNGDSIRTVFQSVDTERRGELRPIPGLLWGLLGN